MCASGAAVPQTWGQTVAGWLRRGAAGLLRGGPLPRHVGFIMDGNRRFADRLHLGSAGGHNRGYDKLVQALEWSLELGVPCVSVYAFSLENFNRGPEEVAVLMDLAERKLLAILQERGIIERHGVRVQVLGDLGRVPPAVAAAAAQCMAATAHQTRCVLNICLAYTSTQETWQALAAVQAQVRQRLLAAEDVTIDLLHQHLYTQGCPPVDLMIRTSGETRLSDFLLLQSSHAVLHFTAALWPEFSFLDMLAALAHYQCAAASIAHIRSRTAAGSTSSSDSARSAGAGNCSGFSAGAGSASGSDAALNSSKEAPSRFAALGPHSSSAASVPELAATDTDRSSLWTSSSSEASDSEPCKERVGLPLSSFQRRAQVQEQSTEEILPVSWRCVAGKA